MIKTLSYGGGVNSSALYFYLVHIKKIKLDLVIFSDTGEESETTMQSIKDMELQCKKDNIKFVKVMSKYGRMIDYYKSKQAIPSMMKRDCTSKFKISPIRQYLRTNYPKGSKFIQYIGIAYDEMHRVSKSDVKYISLEYPFVEDKIDRQGNLDILNQFNFKAEKSGCMGCFYQSKNSWRNFALNHKEEFKRWKEMEENNKHFNRSPNPLYLNGTFSLAQIENFVKYQKSLDKWVKLNDDDLTCPNTRGGCFL